MQNQRRAIQPIPQKTLKCKYCDRRFRNASGRTQHVGVYHPREHATLQLRRAIQSNAMNAPRLSDEEDQHPVLCDGPGTPLGIEEEPISNGTIYKKFDIDQINLVRLRS